jgi:hypothetical protein
VSFKRQKLLTLREHICLPPVLVGSRLLCIFVLICLSSSCVLCTKYCPCHWNAHSWFPSVFSNVYSLQTHDENRAWYYSNTMKNKKQIPHCRTYPKSNRKIVKESKSVPKHTYTWVLPSLGWLLWWKVAMSNWFYGPKFLLVV